MRVRIPPLRLTMTTALLTIIVAGGLMRCGSEKDDKKSGDEGAKPGSGLVPSDWDGLSDYAASAFEVIEE